MTDQSPPSKSAEAPLYRVGTLVYTQSMLFQVFFWMLWGDFCLNLMESVIPRMVPLQLSSLGASNALIGVLTGSVLSALNWFLNPIISTWSDRHRSPIGRRMPFMLYPTPLLAFFLILVGFAGDLATLLNKNSPTFATHLAHFIALILRDGALPVIAQLTIGAIAVLLILYKIFDMFPQTAYYYLFADVIPQQVMGKFTCLFRVFATAGGVAFHLWLLRYATTHPKLIYISCGLLYMIAFTLLSLMVKEGEYPPHPPRSAKKTPAELLRIVVIWFRESFSLVYYWKYFLSFACFRWAFVPFNTFLIIYADKSLHLSTASFGYVMALVMAIQMPVFLAIGPLVDRYHPVRLCIVGYVLMLIAGVAGFFLIHNEKTFLVFTIYAFVAVAIFQGALVSLGPLILPRQRYGQFCAANAMVGEDGLLIFAALCGKFLDVFGLRCLYLWFAFFSLLGIGMIVVLYFGWRAHGGDENYLAPGGFG